jgi:hypothetical protein
VSHQTGNHSLVLKTFGANENLDLGFVQLDVH